MTCSPLCARAAGTRIPTSPSMLPAPSQHQLRRTSSTPHRWSSPWRWWGSPPAVDVAAPIVEEPAAVGETESDLEPEPVVAEAEPDPVVEAELIVAEADVVTMVSPCRPRDCPRPGYCRPGRCRSREVSSEAITVLFSNAAGSEVAAPTSAFAAYVYRPRRPSSTARHHCRRTSCPPRFPPPRSAPAFGLSPAVAETATPAPAALVGAVPIAASVIAVDDPFPASIEDAPETTVASIEDAPETTVASIEDAPETMVASADPRPGTVASSGRTRRGKVVLAACCCHC